MTLVVDASVACKWFVYEEGSDEARKLVETGEALIAPDLVVAEACNAAWKKRRTGRMTPERPTCSPAGSRACSTCFFPAPPSRRAPSPSPRASRTPSTAASILAPAERMNARLVTAPDTRFLQRLQGTAWQAGAVRLGGAPT